MTVLPAHWTHSTASLPDTIGLAALRPSFCDLPVDHYTDGAFRRRALSRFCGPAASLRQLPHREFMQGGLVNHLLGNIQRDYRELAPDVVASSAFRGMIAMIQSFYGFDPHTTMLGVHQIRIVCSIDQSGEPAPEGIHQDGFDYITIICADRVAVSGAFTELYPSPDVDPIYRSELQPGEVVFCNDRKLFHYTSPIQPAAGARQGHRDVFVVTAKTGVMV